MDLTINSVKRSRNQKQIPWLFFLLQIVLDINSMWWQSGRRKTSKGDIADKPMNNKKKRAQSKHLTRNSFSAS